MLEIHFHEKGVFFAQEKLSFNSEPLLQIPNYNENQQLKKWDGIIQNYTDWTQTKDCIFLINNLGIQFATQLFSTVPYPTRLGRQPRPTVTGAKLHQTKNEVNNPNVGSLLLTGYLQSSLTYLVNVANHTDQTRTKVLYVPRKLSRCSVCPSIVFIGAISNKVRYTSAPNNHRCKPSPEKLQIQQPKGK